MASENKTVEEIVNETKFTIDYGNGVLLDLAGKQAVGILDRIEAAHRREVEELRECLKEAIREKCPFTRMSCKHGEPCDYECGTEKWRKALREKGGSK